MMKKELSVEVPVSLEALLNELRSKILASIQKVRSVMAEHNSEETISHIRPDLWLYQEDTEKWLWSIAIKQKLEPLDIHNLVTGMKLKDPVTTAAVRYYLHESNLDQYIDNPTLILGFNQQ